MPDKKLTDSEIIKAWECCMDEMGCTKGCPCFNPKAKGSHCTVAKKLELEKLTLDLINRLQAENEELKREIENLESVQEISPEAKHFVDTKADKVISLLNEVIKSQEQIKAEAYKEFAERLCEDRISNDPVVIAAKCLLKELVGEDG